MGNLVHTSILQPDHSSSPLKKLCTGLAVRVEPGWHTLYLHYGNGETKGRSSKTPIAMGGSPVHPNSNTDEAGASDGTLEIHRGCNTNSEIPFLDPSEFCVE